MSTLDKRGAQLDVKIAADVGWYSTLNIKTDDESTARDLTGETLKLTIKDDRESSGQYGGQYAYDQTYTLTISDAANGVAKIAIPPSEFTNKEAGQLSYECWVTNTSSENDGLLWGYIEVLERG